ncbi:MAG: lyase family protein [Ilumatobacteraceae bacterium]
MSASEPFGFLTGAGAVAGLTSAASWVGALVEVERALAAAQAEAGDVPHDAALAIAEVDDRRLDVEAIVDEAALSGNLVIPLLPRLRALAGEDAAPWVHHRATSQDVIDAATAMIVRWCVTAIADDLRTAADLAAQLEQHAGAAPTIARTLGQQAVPTTFATVTGRWRDGLAGAAERLGRNARQPVWLGGPSGDGTSYGPNHAAVLRNFAANLDLDVATGSTHAQRLWIADVAGACASAAAACAKVGLDVVVLAQDEIGEVAERATGAGGSSSMAHKHNPIAAISARAAAMQVPGLVATLLTAAGSGEAERAAGAWHAEWPALQALLRATGSAAHWVARSLQRLRVDTDRMAANLAAHEARQERG